MTSTAERSRASGVRRAQRLTRPHQAVAGAHAGRDRLRTPLTSAAGRGGLLLTCGPSAGGLALGPHLGLGIGARR